MRETYGSVRNSLAARRTNRFKIKLCSGNETQENSSDEKIILSDSDKPSESDSGRGLINARPLLFASVSLAFSIFLSLKTFENSALRVLVVAVTLSLFGLSLFLGIKRKIKAGVCALIALAFFVGGYAYGACKIEKLESASYYVDAVVVSGKVSGVKDRDSYAILTLTNVYVNSEKINGNVRVYVSSPDKRNVRLPEKFETVKFTAELNKAADEERAFDYLKSGISYVSSPSDEIIIIGDGANLFEKCQKYISGALKSFVSSQNYGVVSAMLLGDSSGVSEQTLDMFRTAGIAHVFAVSGLHIGLFASALGALCKLLKIKRLKRTLIVLIPTFVYVGACGFTASAVRAFIMTAAIIVSSVFGVKHDGLSALSTAAIVILAARPFAVFEYGFLLSFAAVGGITLLARKLERGASALPSFLNSSVSVCLAAQLGTLPILTQMSGYISIISTFANLLFLPALSLIYQTVTVLTVVSLPFYAFGVNAGRVLLFVPDAVLSLVTKVISLVNYDAFALPFSFGSGIIFYYAALFFSSDVVNGKQVNKFAVVTVSLAACALFAALGI